MPPLGGRLHTRTHSKRPGKASHAHKPRQHVVYTGTGIRQRCQIGVRPERSSLGLSHVRCLRCAVWLLVELYISITYCSLDLRRSVASTNTTHPSCWCSVSTYYHFRLAA